MYIDFVLCKLHKSFEGQELKIGSKEAQEILACKACWNVNWETSDLGLQRLLGEV